jgi:hypothetical protein
VKIHTYVLAASITLLAVAIGYFARILDASTPVIVAEIRSMREAVPRYLDQVEILLASVEKAGERAAKGTVVGAVKGAVKAPFSLIAALGGSLRGSAKLSQSEQEVIGAAIENALKRELQGSVYSFEHSFTELAGEIELLSVDAEQEATRYGIRIEVQRKGQSLFKRKLVLERDEEGHLTLLKSIKL